MMRRSLLILWFLGLCSLAQSQTLVAYRDSIPEAYDFWVYVPPEYNAETANYTPVIMFLHGRSLCGHDLAKVRSYGPLDALNWGRRIPAIIIAPQNPGVAWAPTKVDAVLEWVLDRYGGCREMIYVYGMSLGGYGAMDYCATFPEKVAAGIAMCGGTTLRDVEGLRRLPMWIVHGTADVAVPVKCSKDVVEKLEKGGETPLLRYDWLQGYNHSKLARMFYMPEIYDWLFDHTLTDEPRRVNRDFSLTGTVFDRAYKNFDHSFRGAIKEVLHPAAGTYPGAVPAGERMGRETDNWLPLTDFDWLNEISPVVL